MPEPRPGERRLDSQLRVRRGEEVRAVSHQCADDEVARDDLIREEVHLLSIADDVTVVRDELVERLKRLFRTSFLYEAD